jgi:hypothetical protein
MGDIRDRSVTAARRKAGAGPRPSPPSLRSGADGLFSSYASVYPMATTEFAHRTGANLLVRSAPRGTRTPNRQIRSLPGIVRPFACGPSSLLTSAESAAFRPPGVL